MAYRVSIVDDRPQNINSLQEKLHAGGMAVVQFSAPNGAAFLDVMAATSSTAMPQVVLMDIDMPVLDGIETVRQAAPLYPDVRFIMLTVFDDDDKLFEAIQAGAGGYLLKEEGIDAILMAIAEAVDRSGAPMSPRIARKALGLLRNAADSHKAPVPENTLSERETDVLSELINGLDYKQIAVKLFISPNTVRKHIANIYEKLHVTSRAAAVRVAVKNRWV
jgi:DNA-binding NarL/FixJ family response regulator